ncbi:MAG TPA: hypothetical protein VM432_09460, partial [Bdellovibrionales bacterium]|nr:hypothetical protein [Bdellovibrionales bacterium]
MKVTGFKAILAASIVFCSSVSLSQVSDQRRIDELEKRVQQLENPSEAESISDEVTQLKLDRELPELLGPGFTSLGPAASRIYTSRAPFAVGGLAEILYSAPEKGTRTTNLSRADLFVGARLATDILFNSAFEFQN